MAAIASRCENKFSALELRKLLTFEQDLEGLPDKRGCRHCAVDRIGAKREPSPDRLVNIYHYVSMSAGPFNNE